MIEGRGETGITETTEERGITEGEGQGRGRIQDRDNTGGAGRTEFRFE